MTSYTTDSKKDLKLIFETSGGEKVYRSENSVVVKLPPNRNSITTSYINGGYQENLEAIFNHEPNPTRGHCGHDLEGGSVEEYIKIQSKRLGLNPEKTAAMMTAAKMKNAAISTRTFRDLEVTAIVTAGIEVNGGRAGDPANWHEENGSTVYVGGTINTFLILSSYLPAHALTRVIMTATEAKTVAIQQLMAPSRYSNGIATGSGTDQISVISNMSSPNVLTWAGKHSKLGELVALCIIDATTEALDKQTCLNPLTQRDMLVRLNRFGINEDKYWETAALIEGENKKPVFIENLREFSKNPSVVAMTTSLLHIIDEINWGLIPEKSGKNAAYSVMKTLPEMIAVKNQPDFEHLIDEKMTIIENWIRISSWCIKIGF